MKVQSLGHVVVRVADRERAERFYGDLLGLPICARYDKDGYKMAFFTLGNHHDFAVMEVSGSSPTPDDHSIGLDHVAFNIGTTLDELREARDRLHGADVETVAIDHDVTRSLYLKDPDGNGIELYIDCDDGWREQPQRIATVAPLEL
jgi:catechol 2,3-dioxygenase